MLSLVYADDSTTSAAPWWFAAAAALAGVVVGLVGKLVADVLTEGRRRKADDERRFIDLKRESYVKLITQSDALRDAWEKMTAAHVSVDDEDQQVRQRLDLASAELTKAKKRLKTAEANFSDAHDEMVATIDTLRFLANKEIVDSAFACLYSASRARVHERFHSDRTEFIARCRVDLHVDRQGSRTP